MIFTIITWGSYHCYLHFITRKEKQVKKKKARHENVRKLAKGHRTKCWYCQDWDFSWLVRELKVLITVLFFLLACYVLTCSCSSFDASFHHQNFFSSWISTHLLWLISKVTFSYDHTMYLFYYCKLLYSTLILFSFLLNIIIIIILYLSALQDYKLLDCIFIHSGIQWPSVIVPISAKHGIRQNSWPQGKTSRVEDN